MNARDRVTRAIEFSGPDRVPTCRYDPFRGDVLPILSVPPRSWQPPEPYYPYDIHSAVLQLGIWKPERPLPKGWRQTQHTALDEWGNIWEIDGTMTSLGQIRKGALQEGWHLLENYRPPDPRIPERYVFYGIYRRLLGMNRYRLAIGDNFIFSRFHFLRGFEQAMMDLAMNPEEVERLLDIITEHFLGCVEMVGSRGADGILFDDDLGTQKDLIIGPKYWQQYFLPRYERVVSKTHDLGMHFILHSCGNIRRVIPDLISIGVDALQLDSPNQTGIDFLADNFGGKIAFFNVVDIQDVYPKGSPEEIEEYVMRMVHRLGCYNGGLIATTYPTLYAIGSNREQEKLMFRVYRKHGRYPLDRN